MKKCKETCYIFAAGDRVPLLPDEGEAGLVIGADGGIPYALSAMGRVDLSLGDFDSLDASTLPALARPPMVFPSEKDDTDMALALLEGEKRGFTRFLLYGGLGGARVSHTVANLSLLASLARRGKLGFLVGDGCVITAVSSAKIVFPAEAEGYLSVFAYGGDAEGVTLAGVKYPLSGATLHPEISLGVSNELLSGQSAAVSCQSGVLLLIWEGKRTYPLPLMEDHHEL